MAIAAVLLLLATTVGSTASAAQGTPERPVTIPALRDWTPSAGSYALPDDPRVVVPAADREALRTTAQVFAGDLRRLTGLDVRVGSGGVRPGDIAMSLSGADGQLGAEGYRLQVGKAIHVSALTDAGVFYGTRSVLQLLRQSDRIPAGTARDWPRYPERGLMVDIGRKHFTLGWLKQQVRELAYLKLNYLHLHLNDNEGWRIASDTHPEVVSEQHLSEDQVRELIAFAARHHVQVVPEIDMPGHLQSALAKHPELQLRNAFGQPDPHALDYTKPEARAFARELIEEYLPLFPSRYWHTGADEFPTPIPPPPLGTALYPQLQAFGQQHYGPSANAQDAYIWFINWVDGIVGKQGKTLRVWNDGVGGPIGAATVAKLNKDIVVEWWNNPQGPASGPGPQEFIEQGHTVLNAGWLPTYYVNGSDRNTVPPRPDMRWAYESWQVNQFYGVYYLNETATMPPFTLAAGEPANRGSKIHVWNDKDAETEAQIAEGIAPRLRVLAQKTWDTAPLVPGYPEFESIMDAVGHNPHHGTAGK